MRIFSYEELDELGEGLIRQYLGKEAERTCCVDIEGFVTDFLKLPLLYRSFRKSVTNPSMSTQQVRSASFPRYWRIKPSPNSSISS